MKFIQNKMENLKIIISFHNMLFEVLVFSTDDCFSIMLVISIKEQENKSMFVTIINGCSWHWYSLCIIIAVIIN